MDKLVFYVHLCGHANIERMYGCLELGIGIHIGQQCTVHTPNILDNHTIDIDNMVKYECLFIFIEQVNYIH